ncbi:MAG: hypothetical protein BWY17_00134 [Deltaproteobacteria bacterium ADurb.Bin207]|jgi:hypothetical protein|nr:MAG: hypothetical protein BWY17_00134 [Deltaproteobacteria bacterium ADurb.Bin207]
MASHEEALSGQGAEKLIPPRLVTVLPCVPGPNCPGQRRLSLRAEGRIPWQVATNVAPVQHMIALPANSVVIWHEW